MEASRSYKHSILKVHSHPRNATLFRNYIEAKSMTNPAISTNRVSRFNIAETMYNIEILRPLNSGYQPYQTHTSEKLLNRARDSLPHDKLCSMGGLTIEETVHKHPSATQLCSNPATPPQLPAIYQ